MSDWKLVNCGDVIDVRDGTHESPKYVENGIPLVTSKNLINGKLSLDEVSYISQNDFENINRRSKVDNGDILYSMIGSIGNYAIMEEVPNFAIKNVALFKFNNESVFNKFFYHLLNSSSIKKQIENQQKGGTQKFVSLSILRNLQIPLPPLDTQKKIAAILDAADVYRQKTKTLIAKYDQLVQSLFLDMFGDPVNNKKGFPKTTLKELIIDVKNGISRRRKVEENTGDIVLRLRDIRSNNIDYSEVNRILLVKEEMKKYQIKISDLLFIRVNGNPEYVGRCAVFMGFNESVYFNDHIMRVRIKDDNNSIFLSHFLNSSFGKNQIAMYRKTSAGQHTINQFGLEKIELYKPPFSLQNQFADRVEAIEAQKQQAQASLQKAEDLFNSLLQRAFKGELVS